ncbi:MULTISPECIES: response regulator [unclassified Coleofasciculus]|uniref:hybrid sensor histidine kinase/response regulator n=1 Tax=unclassified Coleofasciculus TaxID=2692782 RepID=UPI00187F4A4B|nr:MULTISPECIES: response regulator [unclassified Coleofasciculus]MBE9126548.1 response regulator [Coleofasciculus sp. LEGE 07081]MBE9149982.1 response regulator [Coleofasciculus sp. LEGE 07092]
MDKKNSILVVDDEPNAFDVIEAHLYREGYDLFYAGSGYEALSRLDAVEPDVILLDVMMPQMDGIEVCHQIKSDSHWHNVPIIIVTALNSKEDLARSLNAGADDFITKPLSGLELRARVRSMLRIKQQYDGLEATLRLREDLSNMIVHDLRNPLTNILLCSGLLLQSGVDEKTLKRLEIIADSGRELNSMIDNLLMLAKMESGKMVLNRLNVNLNELTSKVVSQFQAIADHKKIQLISKLAASKRGVLLDANLFHRVLENLLSNAIKFSPAEKTVILQLDYPNEPMNLDSSSAQAIIQVIDSGAGVSEERKQLIFDKYEVGEVKSGVSQIGLGLTFCKMVIEAHGGRIWVENNQPRGSIFTVVV